MEDESEGTGASASVPGSGVVMFEGVSIKVNCTIVVEPLLKDTPEIRTPLY